MAPVFSARHLSVGRFAASGPDAASLGGALSRRSWSHPLENRGQEHARDALAGIRFGDGRGVDAFAGGICNHRAMHWHTAHCRCVHPDHKRSREQKIFAPYVWIDCLPSSVARMRNASGRHWLAVSGHHGVDEGDVMLRSWSPFKWPKFCGGARLAVVGSDHARDFEPAR
jgi:hypothetical protein